MIQHIQNSKLPAILQAVCHEVHQPDHVRLIRNGQRIGFIPLQALPWLDPQVSFYLVEYPLDPFVILQMPPDLAQVKEAQAEAQLFFAHLGIEMAASLSSQSLLQQFCLHVHLCIHLLQPTILILQSLHLTGHRCIHAAICETRQYSFHVLGKGVPPPLLPAKDCKNLWFAKLLIFVEFSSIRKPEKIILLKRLFCGDYPQTAI